MSMLVHLRVEGVKIGQNLVHVVVECPHICGILQEYILHNEDFLLKNSFCRFSIEGFLLKNSYIIEFSIKTSVEK